MLKSASHSILGGLILKIFGNKKGILCSVDFKCCDLLLKLFSNSRSNSQNFWQAFKSHISTKFTRYSLHTKLPRAPPTFIIFPRPHEFSQWTWPQHRVYQGSTMPAYIMKTVFHLNDCSTLQILPWGIFPYPSLNF